ncbi:MAG: adenylate cyclase [Desulfuromonadales bacterium C00003094]|jgi:CYTH domain-containing protein|nr:MAG: adenylate cyclase [Desulfuromonadales bacterium C00003094]
MAIEIERKFLLRNADWRKGAIGTNYRQGYLSIDPERTVRVRIAGDQGYLTIKGKTVGMSRAEFEYSIPLAEATQLLDTLCLRPLIEKVRYCVPYAKHLWEIDEFAGENEGLILAEVELETHDQQVDLPPWVEKEVTTDPRYYNASLTQNPYRDW